MMTKTSISEREKTSSLIFHVIASFDSISTSVSACMIEVKLCGVETNKFHSSELSDMILIDTFFRHLLTDKIKMNT